MTAPSVVNPGQRLDVARYTDGPAAGGAAITRHAFGHGRGWYVSTRLDVDDLASVLDPAYADAGLTPAALTTRRAA